MNNMLKQEGFEILIASPSDYEQLVAEIYFDGRFVALVSQERGPGQFDIETPGTNLDEKQIIRKVEWDGFCMAKEEACEQLSGKKVGRASTFPNV
jgi:hypothetical protein